MSAWLAILDIMASQTAVTQWRGGVPPVREIQRHWMRATAAERRFPGADGSGRLSSDAGEPSCFACGWWHDSCPTGCTHKLERAHVIPHANGGPDSDPGNYALLCARCHREAPDTDDPTYFWRWVDEYPENRDPVHLERQQWLEVERLAKPGLSKLGIDFGVFSATWSPEAIRAAYMEAHTLISPVAHNGRYSAATRARVLVEAVTRLAEKQR